jgi:integrase
LFREPKGKSKRTVALPPELVPLLRRHRAAQRREKMAAGDRWEDNDLVFCREDGQPIARNDDWREWKDVLDAAGVRDTRVHDGRHTAGTLLVEQGVHIRTVQEILGHRSVNTTERYVHVASPMAQAAAREWAPLCGERPDETATQTATPGCGCDASI